VNPTIRPPLEVDLPVLVEIEQASFTHPHWTAANFLKYHTRVAEVDGSVVGFVVAREVFSGGNGDLPEREIMNLAVAPSHRRLGIASILIRSVLDRKGNYFLEVRESNLAAQRLYQKFGFVPVGTRKGYYQHPIESAIVMHLKWC
jgi:ribosomal-protein-alanine N-acetyltransferase